MLKTGKDVVGARWLLRPFAQDDEAWLWSRISGKGVAGEIQAKMNNSSLNNHHNSTTSSIALLKEADGLAKSNNWTRDFALYVMYCRAIADEDKIRAEKCIELLEREFKNSVW